MATTFQSQTLSVSIRRAAQEVYEFVLNPENLPNWASAFCRAVRRTDAGWIIETAAGELKLRFVEANPFGVADHYLIGEPDAEIYVPMRVVPNGSGSEVLITLFRQPGVSGPEFGQDVGSVTRDLRKLKDVLES